jgi:hypothetical protein
VVVQIQGALVCDLIVTSPGQAKYLRRLIRDCVSYYQQDRIHDSLEKETPNRCSVEHKPSPNSVVISNARVGGLHHRQSRSKAAQGLQATLPFDIVGTRAL